MKEIKNAELSASQTLQPDKFTQIATRVSLVSILGNLVLSLFKLIAGLVAHSSAMVSDATHSASDVFSSIVVIIGVRLAAQESDEEHPYGHERLECVAAIVLSTVLLITGLFIGYEAVQKIIHLADGSFLEKIEVPGLLALVAAIVSIISKEAMFWYTKINAKKIGSAALLADAWHHRSDALSSIGALIGILFARAGFAYADPVASLIICLFIAKAAYDIFKDATQKMVDHACDGETEKAILDLATSQEGVLSIDLLHTRVFGNRIYVDMEIGADENLTLLAAHDIAEKVHDSIEQAFPNVKHIMVHVNPVKSR